MSEPKTASMYEGKIIQRPLSIPLVT
jgi:hypothetical protein